MTFYTPNVVIPDYYPVDAGDHNANLCAIERAINGIASSTTLGNLGFSAITDTNILTTATTDIGGGSVAVTVGVGRRIKITGFLFVQPGAGAGRIELLIRESTTQLANTFTNVPASSDIVTAIVQVVLTPSTGSHTYKLSVKNNTANTITAGQVSDAPGFILVEDIGI